MTNPDYARGYNRGKASIDLDRYRRAVNEALERARRAEAQFIGHCKNCTRWSRNPGCAWGYCNPPGTVDIGNQDWWGEPGHKVCTQENFGCVRFLATPDQSCHGSDNG